ncbi:dicarboxylate:amino acid:cation symporter DAACS family protein [Lentibacillus kapialis]|uniref:Dicarboxylate:amino acid:cation symporter DAACS family protein n=1 Tax=Lentibacillus kapialis TaxID=340214 RepID=A0A917PZD8_9BACI|nr:dicarboxylate/amino acid:cation symporter [Lentibacillus kapialis]GGK01802.1 dicarboxylate:amino acid:cation symporter DAACS family protein [Lentibacillus kapialis]
MKKSLIWQLVVAFILAIATGIIFGDKAQVVQPLGDLFLRLIKFIIAPLVLATLVIGVASTSDVKKLGRLGGKTVAFYLITSMLAITLGIVAGKIFSPGSGIDVSLEGKETPEPTETEGVVQTILNIVPTNPFEALSSGNILQIIFFALAIGIAITLVGEKAKPVQQFFEGFAEVMYKITGMVMAIVPIGVFGLLAPVVGAYGAEVLLPLIKLILAMLVACIIQLFVVYALIVKALGKISPIRFFKGVFPASAVAFSTSSSSGTLPVTLKSVQENLGVSKETSTFVLPLGATINMDGTALYVGLCSMFIAQYFGMDLTLSQMATVVLTGTLASIGTAGVPGAGLIMLTMALSAVNLPLAGIALVGGIDRILDMMRTSVNVTGDAAASVVVDASEKRTLQAEQ